MLVCVSEELEDSLRREYKASLDQQVLQFEREEDARNNAERKKLKTEADELVLFLSFEFVSVHVWQSARARSLLSAGFAHYVMYPVHTHTSVLCFFVLMRCACVMC